MPILRTDPPVTKPIFPRKQFMVKGKLGISPIKNRHSPQKKRGFWEYTLFAPHSTTNPTDRRLNKGDTA